MSSPKKLNLRALAAKCVYAVVDQGRSLSEELPKQQDRVEGKDKGLLQEICYGVLRYLPELENDVRGLVDKPLKGKQRVFHFLMLVGVYQIKYTRIPDHAAVSETVAATVQLKNSHLKGLINGVLRNFQRVFDNVVTGQTHIQKLPDPIKYNHPGWFIKKVQAAYPDQWQSILAANQERPPMWLRVNSQHHDLETYLSLLDEAGINYCYTEPLSGAIALVQAVDVNKLPGFSDGWVSIQDAAAQQAARLLDSQPGDLVLDCCAAPGGKTCHILERTPDLAGVTAIDIEENRLLRVKENLERLQLNANVITADAATTEGWWDNKQFDRILLDAPCSGTGVIRRHPDIKWLRKASDIDNLLVLQQQILKNIWSVLKPGGTLLYATCSVLPQENDEQIKRFLEEQDDAELVVLTEGSPSVINAGIDSGSNKVGWQILPTPVIDNEADPLDLDIPPTSMDGFYYAKLIKKVTK
jgi:16S rRNA (cytosine967-C5)-methyltransferase